ncbi:acyl-CoA dehydrogenase family protein [Microbaculum marinisediminis]|uniref:Acyl-[acyl-carrier-protein] dehydrogenase MbtN n=1 Tax=Microbaculum marinisediminis TaxID=2931392 RepID=A0AAW5QUN1_9HYPH|nr:acyl-CoA dehydrogenase family protein [Microbaculum sp. A6E488]MCT8970677.1 acyl-CoA dehydrogenase family protein [Microbaculum sp. A6E488]
MTALDVPRPDWMSEDVVLLEDQSRRFFDAEMAPHYDGWIDEGIVPRWAWEKTGEAGLLCAAMPEEYGGAGGSFAHEAVITYQLGMAGLDSFGIALHNAIVAPYILHFGSEDQKKRWLPKLATGEMIGAIAMTEPGAGSDLQGVRTTARKDGNHYRISGSKTFITNGQNANLVIVVAKTDPAAGARGTSLFVVETDAVEGFRRGRNLKKLGLKAQDTSELFFDDVRVPADALLGAEEGQGFVQLMTELPQERLLVAVQAMAMIERALEVTIAYVKERQAFGKAVMEFQNTQFALAEAKTEATIAKVFMNHCIGQLIAGRLDSTTASMAKYWLTDLQCKIVDQCLQLHGGYGYMAEYPISRMYQDARVQRIYAGTNEIMKLLIARSL